MRGVVGHHRHGVALHAREARHDVLGEVGHNLWWFGVSTERVGVRSVGLVKPRCTTPKSNKSNPIPKIDAHLEEVALVHHLPDDLGHVVGQVGVVRAEVPQALLPPEARVLLCASSCLR